MDTLLGFVLGGVVSWAITHWYERRASVRVPAWARPLLRRLAEAAPPRAKLRALFREALEEVEQEQQRSEYRDQEDDEESGFDELEECPKCQSQDVEVGDDADARGNVFETAECLSCGWRDRQGL